jgi:hypothetical protein
MNDSKDIAIKLMPHDPDRATTSCVNPVPSIVPMATIAKLRQAAGNFG